LECALRVLSRSLLTLEVTGAMALILGVATLPNSTTLPQRSTICNTVRSSLITNIYGVHDFLISHQRSSRRETCDKSLSRPTGRENLCAVVRFSRRGSHLYPLPCSVDPALSPAASNKATSKSHRRRPGARQNAAIGWHLSTLTCGATAGHDLKFHTQ
jgi:hypothetical protein